MRSFHNLPLQSLDRDNYTIPDCNRLTFAAITDCSTTTVCARACRILSAAATTDALLIQLPSQTAADCLPTISATSGRTIFYSQSLHRSSIYLVAMSCRRRPHELHPARGIWLPIRSYRTDGRTFWHVKSFVRTVGLQPSTCGRRREFYVETASRCRFFDLKPTFRVRIGFWFSHKDKQHGQKPVEIIRFR